MDYNNRMDKVVNELKHFIKKSKFKGERKNTAHV